MIIKNRQFFHDDGRPVACPFQQVMLIPNKLGQLKPLRQPCITDCASFNQEQRDIRINNVTVKLMCNGRKFKKVEIISEQQTEEHSNVIKINPVS